MSRAWKVGAAALSAAVVVAATLVSLADAWGTVARFARENPAAGWAIAAVAVLTVPVAWALGRHGVVVGDASAVV